MRDKTLANGGHIGCCQKMKINDNDNITCVPNHLKIIIGKLALHLIDQRNFEIMVYGKTKYYFTSPDFTSF
jgi:hypothetical protein